jgi:hypothetical protein
MVEHCILVLMVANILCQVCYWD